MAWLDANGQWHEGDRPTWDTTQADQAVQTSQMGRIADAIESIAASLEKMANPVRVVNEPEVATNDCPVIFTTDEGL